jgi:hypothetical protein
MTLEIETMNASSVRGKNADMERYALAAINGPSETNRKINDFMGRWLIKQKGPTVGTGTTCL